MNRRRPKRVRPVGETILPKALVQQYGRQALEALQKQDTKHYGPNAVPAGARYMRKTIRPRVQDKITAKRDCECPPNNEDCIHPTCPRQPDVLCT